MQRGARSVVEEVQSIFGYTFRKANGMYIGNAAQAFEALQGCIHHHLIHIRAATTAINTLLRVGSRLTVCQEVSQVLVTI